VSEPVIAKAASRRSLWPLWAMVIIFALPVAAAWFYYFNPEFLPEARANRGELIQPVRPWPADLQFSEPDGRAFDAATMADHWTLLTVSRSPCNLACREKLVELRQIRLALGESSLVVERMALLVGGAPQPALGATDEFAGTREVVAPVSAVPQLTALLGPQQEIWNRIYIVDPLGNLMMRYAADAPPKDVLKDMERLLKASKNWIKGAQYGHR
jgi:hypothetical protein